MDGQPKLVWDVIKKIHISPAEEKNSPGMMEIKREIPCNRSTYALVVNFDKGFLRIDEYPPDANQGFDLPSTHISFPYFQANRWYSKEKALESSLLLEFLDKSLVQPYTEVLLVPLATPDFSMPYNVITLTCTVLALYFESFLNVFIDESTRKKYIIKEKKLDNVRILKQISMMIEIMSILLY